MGLGIVAGCAGQRTATQASPPTAPGREWCLADELPSQEAKHGVGGAFALLNKHSLEAHARARSNTCQRIASQLLVIRYSLGTLEAYWKGELLRKSFVLPR